MYQVVFKFTGISLLLEWFHQSHWEAVQDGKMHSKNLKENQSACLNIKTVQILDFKVHQRSSSTTLRSFHPHIIFLVGKLKSIVNIVFIFQNVFFSLKWCLCLRRRDVVVEAERPEVFYSYSYHSLGPYTVAAQWN